MAGGNTADNLMRLDNYKMLEPNPKPEILRPEPAPANKQPRKLLIALSLLLAVLAVVLVRDSEFWFGSEESSESDSGSSETAKTSSTPVPAKTTPPQTATASTTKNQPAKTHTATTLAATAPTQQPNPQAPVVATNRVVLPPLDVEVVAGDTHKTIHPGSNVMIAEIAGASNRNPKSTISTTPSTNAAEREPLSTAGAPELRQTIEKDSGYPLLGHHSRVQGSVILEAVVAADGAIENLRVVSGPAILSAAAQQAVREWRFKPYLQNGQAVETKARITVNFTIRVSDDPTKTS